MSKRLTRQEAEEYTSGLGQSVTGNYALMEFAMHTLKVPQALDMEPDEWVQQELGGFVQRSTEQRREAVAALKAEGKKNSEIAEVLGIGRRTVARDLEVLAVIATNATQDALPAPSGAKSATQDTSRKLTPEEKKAAIRKLLKKGRTNAEIALELGIGVSTVSKERTAWNNETKQPSEKLRKAQEQQSKVKPLSPAEEKAAEAEFEQIANDLRTAIHSGSGPLPGQAMQYARQALVQVLSAEVDLHDFDQILQDWAEFGRELWIYGAKKGYDVSPIVRLLEQLGGD
jgi:DNA-binding NarL/FixJ family response regulator